MAEKVTPTARINANKGLYTKEEVIELLKAIGYAVVEEEGPKEEDANKPA